MSIAIAKRHRAVFETSAEPNVIPFIDVLLVLLIIFMVTAPRPTTDIKLELPGPHSIPHPVTIPPTVIDLRSGGSSGARIFIGEQQIALEALPGEVLARALATNAVLTNDDVFAEARVYVRADDQGIAYGSVVAVLDELQTAGFSKVGVFAQTAEAAP